MYDQMKMDKDTDNYKNALESLKTRQEELYNTDLLRIRTDLSTVKIPESRDIQTILSAKEANMLVKIAWSEIGDTCIKKINKFMLFYYTAKQVLDPKIPKEAALLEEFTIYNNHIIQDYKANYNLYQRVERWYYKIYTEYVYKDDEYM